MNMENFIRRCPTCDKIIKYKSKYNLKFTQFIKICNEKIITHSVLYC